MEGRNTIHDDFVGKFAQEYSFFDYTKNPDGTLTQDQVDKVRKDFQLDLATETARKYNQNSGAIAKKEWQQTWMNIGLNSSREDSIQAICYVWCMGSLGFEISEVMELNKKGSLTRVENGVEKTYTIKDVQTAFHDFCEQNPLANLDKNPNDIDMFKKNMRTWVDIFAKCNEKSKAYALPEIDFNNQEQIKNHLDDFYFIRSLIINVSQEFDRITSVQNNSVYAKTEAMRAAGGEKEFQDISGFWENLQCVLGPLLNGYLLSVPKSFKAGEYMKCLAQMADGRYKISIRPDIFTKGRTLGDLAKEAKKNHLDLYLFSTDSNQQSESFKLVAADPNANLDATEQEKNKLITDGNTERCDIINYLSGDDKDSYAFKSNQRFDQAKKSFIENDTYNMEADVEKHLLVDAGLKTKFPDGKTLKEKILELDPNDKDAMRNFLNEKSSNEQTVSVIVSRCFKELMSPSLRSFAVALDVHRCDILLLDDKTATELYGEKYKNVTNPVEKDLLLQAEVIRNIAEGKSVISVRRFGLNENNQPEEKPSVKLYLSEKKMIELYRALDVFTLRLGDMTAELESYKELFSQTQVNRKANFDENEEQPEGSADYAALGRNLQYTIDILKDKDSTPEQIRSALRNLKIAADNYVSVSTDFSLRTVFNFFFQKKEDFRTERIAQAKRLSKSIDNLLNDYNYYRGEIDRSKLIVETNSSSHVEAKDASLNQLNRCFRKYISNRDVKVGKENSIGLKEYIYNQMADKLSRLVKYDISKAENKDNIKLAKQYLLEHLRNKKDELNSGKIAENNLSFDILLPFYQIDSELENLANNPFFVSWMKKNPEECKKNYDKKFEELLNAARDKSKHELGDGEPADRLTEKINNGVIKLNPENLPTINLEFAKLIKNVLFSDSSYYGKMFAVASQCNQAFDKKLEEEIISIIDKSNLLGRHNGVQLTLDEINNGSILAVMMGKGEAISKACFTQEIVEQIYNTMTADLKVEVKNEENNIQNENPQVNPPVNDNQHENENHDIQQNNQGENHDNQQNNQNENNEIEEQPGGNNEPGEQPGPLQNVNRVQQPDPDFVGILQRIGSAALTFNRDEVSAVCNRYHIITQSTSIPTFENDQQKNEFVNAATNAGFNGSRFDSMSSIYRLYLMSEKNLTARQAFQVMPGDEIEKEYRSDFVEFMKRNQVTGEGVDSQKEKTSKTEWMRIYKNGLEKINAYSFPDIDFSNPEQVQVYQAELLAVAKFPINYGQELERLAKTGDINITYEACGGQAEYAKLLNGVQEIFTFSQYFKNAYAHSKIVNEDEAGVKENLTGDIIFNACTEIVFARSYLNLLRRNMAQKTVSEIRQASTNQDLFLKNGLSFAQDEVSTKAKSHHDSIFTKENIDANLTGRGRNLLDFCSEKIQQGISKGKDYFNVEEYSYFTTTFLNELESATDFFRKNPLGEDAVLNQGIVLAQNSPYMEIVAKAFSKIALSGDNPKLLEQVGKKPFELFHIGGKTPEELWGAKYEHLNEADREKMYQAEICNQIVNGLDEVKADIMQIDNDDNIVLGGSCVLVHSVLDAQKQLDYINKFDRIKNEVSEFYDEVYSLYQKHFENGDANKSKAFYQGTIEKLKQCLSYLEDESERKKFKARGNFEKAKELFEAAVQDVTGRLEGIQTGDEYAGKLQNAQNLMNEVETLHNQVGQKPSTQIVGNDVDTEGRLSSQFSMDVFRNHTKREFKLRDLLVLESDTPQKDDADIEIEKRSFDSLTKKIQKRGQHRFISDLDRSVIRARFYADDGKIVKDFDEMLEFAQENREWLNSLFVGSGSNKLVSQKMLDDFNVKVSDLFIINGNEASTKYQEEFEGIDEIEDSDLKEAFLQACILRDICNGEVTIRCKMYEEKDENYAALDETNTVSVTTESMDNLVNKFVEFDLEEQYYQSQFKSIKEELLKTQGNPMGNLEEGAKDGSDLYRDMFLALVKVIDLSDENLGGIKNHSKKEMDEALDELKQKADKYFNSRGKIKLLGWGSPWTDKGKRRKGLAASISKLADERKKNYEKSTKIVDEATQGLVTSDGKTLKDSEYGKIRDYVHNMERNHTVPEESLSESARKYASAKVSSNISKDFFQRPEIPGDEKYQKAQEYLKAYYEKNKGNMDLKTANSIVNYYPEKVKELAENRLFITLYERYGVEEMVKHWPKHEKRAENGIKKALMDLQKEDMLSDRFGTRTYSDYVAGISGERIRRNHGQEFVTAENTIRQIVEAGLRPNASPDERKALDDCYRRMALAVVTQIAIYDEVIGKRMRTFISLNEKFSTDFVTVTMTSMKEARILEGSNLPKALKRLDNGKLAGEMSFVFKNGGREIQNADRVVKEDEFKMNKPGEFKSAIKMNG